jgi:uncharacterized membrane protein YfcA
MYPNSATLPRRNSVRHPALLESPILFSIILFLTVGLFSGFVGGLLGIGGGIIIVPVLFLLFSSTGLYPPDSVLLVAVATSLACIVFTSASAAYAQVKAQRVLWPAVWRLLPFLLLGSASAGYVAPLLPVEALRIGFAVFITVVACIMFFDWKPKPHRTLPGPLASAPIGLVAGGISGLAGIAGGNVVVPTLIYFNVPAHNATATASTLGVPIAAVGALSYMLLAPETGAAGLAGYIDITAFVFIVLGAVVAAPLGVAFAQRLPASRLKRIFALMLILVALRMAL